MMRHVNKPAAHHVHADLSPGDGNNNIHVKSICDWLVLVIEYDPDQEEMESHAQQLVQLGLHSVDMI